MSEDALLLQPEFREAYRAHERQQRIDTGRVASALVVFLMPAGVVLDYFVYREQLGYFLMLRLACSALAGVLWYLHTTPFGQAHIRWLGLPIALLPALCIVWMIHVEEGPDSPYYAGLNLILLAVSMVVRWNVFESVLAVSVVILMYLIGSAAHDRTINNWSTDNWSSFVNNVYFLVLTGIIVVTGNTVFNRLRFREFRLKFELETNRQALEESNKKLVEMDQIKGRFFANISHELRTPLTLLIAPLETITNRFASTFDADTMGLLRTMQGNGLRLLKLINDLLDLVRLDSGVMQVKREPVPLEEFIKGMASAAQQIADDKKINLTTHVDPALGAVLLDRDKLEKIIINLQFNALKFTKSGGKVELRAERQGEHLVLSVADTGIGIPARDLPKMFERFFQVDGSSRRKYQGVGIGLALVKELVEVHEGTVSVESVEGRGSTFTVRLPYLPAPPGAVAAAVPEVFVLPGEAGPEPPTAVPAQGTVSSEEWLSNLYHRANLFAGPTASKDLPPAVLVAPNSQLPTILIADDQADMLNFLRSQLAPHYNVIETADGQQAVDQATARPPDLILLDMMMPEKDGLQACRELRAHPSTQNIPIILLTARADEEAKLAALSAGASDFLPKPFSTTELHVRIRNLVQSYEFQRTLARQKQELQGTIDQLKETETLLVHTEKLASLGRMSAGLIHEINNPLNFATTGLYTLRKKARLLPADDQAEYTETLKDVEEGIGRVKTIVSDLRSFTHPDTASLDEVSVPESVTAAMRFLSHSWRDQTRIEVDVPAGMNVWANRNSFTQVLLNLLQNALDSLQKQEFNEETPVISIVGRQENGRSLLIVRDNGTGIPPEIIDKIFDPFFTTKDVGEGMGLGLSICHRIVEASGGTISVRSEPGKLCEFTLDFPQSPPKQY